MERIITEQCLNEFRQIMVQREKSRHTIEKYMRDIRKLQDYAGTGEVSQELLVQYKEYLEHCGRYRITSINSFLAAANCFCETMGWCGIRIKMVRVQREAFIPDNQELTKKEYRCLIETALRQGNEKLALIIQTLGSTGIRISELPFITVESLHAQMAEIYNKGKMRRILYPTQLVHALKGYAKREKITEGSLFCTRSGQPMNRSNIWRAMKQLCEASHVDPEKVYPHNLRHLFARCFYDIRQDIARLADVLGHCNIETTRIYIKSTGREHKKHLNKMNMIVTAPSACGKAGEKERIGNTT